MKKRKVLISALLAAAVVSTAALTSCGDKNDDNKKTTTSADAGTTTQGDVTTTSGQGGTTTQGDVTTTTQGDVTTTTQGDVTTTTSEQGGTTTTEEVIDNKATLELHYNGADLDEVSDSIEIDLTEDDGDGVKYAEIPSDKLTVRDTYREFKGWFTNKELTIPATADQLQYIEEDTTLYAKWEAVGSMTTFEVNATSDLGAGTLANDYKKGIYTVKSGSTIRSASPTGEYSTGYTQEIQGNGNMQIYISPLENTTLSVIYCQRSTGSVSSAELFEVVDGVVSDTSIAQIYCSTDGTKTGTKLASNATGKKDIEVEGGKTYLLKGTGGTCSVLDITCQYEVTPSPVDSVEVITAKSIDLIEGESFDSAAVGVKRNFENGTSEDLSTGFTIDDSELDLTQEGVYTVTVNYAPEEYIYGKLKGTTYTDEITVNVYSIKELILGFNKTVSEKGTYNGIYVNHTVKTIYKAGIIYFLYNSILLFNSHNSRFFICYCKILPTFCSPVFVNGACWNI